MIIVEAAMIPRLVFILALTATLPGLAQTPVPPPQPPTEAKSPISPERQAEIAAKEAHLAAALKAAEAHQRQREQEAACTAEARKKASGLALVKMIAVSGDASRGRQFVRLSWDPRDAPRVDQAAFECFFANDRLATAGFATILIADPPPAANIAAPLKVDRDAMAAAEEAHKKAGTSETTAQEPNATASEQERRRMEASLSSAPRIPDAPGPDAPAFVALAEKEAACIARLERGRPLPDRSKLTIVFHAGEPQQTLRVSWTASESNAGYVAFKCVFHSHRLWYVHEDSY